MCGIFACILRGGCEHTVDIGGVIRDGLLQLQHRGEESAGIVGSTSTSAEHFQIVKGCGLVSNVFNAENLSKLKGCYAAVGHTRYSTFGQKEGINCIQPFVVYTAHGQVALAHNGELVNTDELRETKLQNGLALSTNTDSELITLILSSTPDMRNDWSRRIIHFMHESPLSYSLAIFSAKEGTLYAARDPYGNRPLCVAELRSYGGERQGFGDVCGWIVSSESCALSCIGARFLREIRPGEVLPITKNGIQEHRSVVCDTPARRAFCIFEYIYFANSASVLEEQQVYSARFRCGQRLGVEAPVVADIVSNVPDSAGPAAKGYSKQTGIPFMDVLMKNSYVGRTFIRPNTKLRVSGVTMKFSVLHENFRGKRLVLIDDSIVRGTTMKQVVRTLREHGAKEVHIRIASPPIQHPCYMGINIPTREELIANSMKDIKHYRERDSLTDYESQDLARELGADSVVYLSVEGLVAAVKGGNEKGGLCTACLTEEYPSKQPSDIEDLVAMVEKLKRQNVTSASVVRPPAEEVATNGALDVEYDERRPSR